MDIDLVDCLSWRKALWSARACVLAILTLNQEVLLSLKSEDGVVVDAELRIFTSPRADEKRALGERMGRSIRWYEAAEMCHARLAVKRSLSSRRQLRERRLRLQPTRDLPRACPNSPGATRELLSITTTSMGYHVEMQRHPHGSRPRIS